MHQERSWCEPGAHLLVPSSRTSAGGCLHAERQCMLSDLCHTSPSSWDPRRLWGWMPWLQAICTWAEPLSHSGRGAAVSGIEEGVWMRRVRVCERGFAPAAEADPV